MLNSGKDQFMIKPAIAGSRILTAPAILFKSTIKIKLTETVDLFDEPTRDGRH